MTITKRIAAALAALICCSPLMACSDNNLSVADQPAQSAETSADAQSCSEAEPAQLPAEGEVSELITPDPSAEEAELGSYRLAPDGVKLYYEDGEYPAEVMLALDRYFTAYAERDYDAYLDIVYPSYAEKYDEYLQKEYDYDLEKSFNTQCDNLEVNMGGEFRVTRVRAETPELPEGETRDQAIEKFFERMNNNFGIDYYAEVRDEIDNNFQYMLFFIIAENTGTGEESLLVSEFEIIFAEKDGKYYVFG